VSRASLAELVADPTAPLVAGVDQPIKLSHSSVVVKSVLNVGGEQVEVAYKRSRAKNLARRIGHALVPGRAFRGWQMGHALAIRGIATPRPIALVQRGSLLRGRETFLATEWIAGGLDLHAFIWKLEERSVDDRNRAAHQLAAALGRLLGRMHAWNV